MKHETRNDWVMWMRAMLLIFGLALTGAGVGCTVDDSVVRAQANDAHKQIDRAVLTDPVLNDYVAQIGRRVVMAAREAVKAGYEQDNLFREDPQWMFEDVKFHLVASDTLNAFTTGGQHVYLYTELFATSATEDEFAAVVAHEFAHIFGRHVHNGMRRQYAILGSALAAGAAGYALGGDDREQVAMMLAGGTLVGGQFVGAGFSRKDEDQADKFGFRFYVIGGWDPDRFGDFFRQMVAKGYDTSDPMASHPQLSQRVKNAERRAAEWKNERPDWQRHRQPNIVGPQRFAELRDRARKLTRSMPKDKSLEAAQLMLAAFPSCVAPTAQPSQTKARKRVAELLQDIPQ